MIVGATNESALGHDRRLSGDLFDPSHVTKWAVLCLMSLPKPVTQ
jgi:hypothetical protein